MCPKYVPFIPLHVSQSALQTLKSKPQQHHIKLSQASAELRHSSVSAGCQDPSQGFVFFASGFAQFKV